MRLLARGDRVARRGGCSLLVCFSLFAAQEEDEDMSGADSAPGSPVAPAPRSRVRYRAQQRPMRAAAQGDISSALAGGAGMADVAMTGGAVKAEDSAMGGNTTSVRSWPRGGSRQGQGRGAEHSCPRAWFLSAGRHP